MGVSRVTLLSVRRPSRGPDLFTASFITGARRRKHITESGSESAELSMLIMNELRNSAVLVVAGFKEFGDVLIWWKYCLGTSFGVELSFSSRAAGIYMDTCVFLDLNICPGNSYQF